VEQLEELWLHARVQQEEQLWEALLQPELLRKDRLLPLLVAWLLDQPSQDKLLRKDRLLPLLVVWLLDQPLQHELLRKDRLLPLLVA